ncbi:hypothetical protein DL96DRAFT_1575539 [Flagelloscypha sp. PMI_526]|nr:hypothetical protein DL96DRAFT_1575539 [Flagelloscypha sp. PMI_526]
MWLYRFAHYLNQPAALALIISMAEERPTKLIPDEPSAVEAARKRVSKPPKRFSFARHRQTSSPATPLTVDLDALPSIRIETASIEDKPVDVIDLSDPPEQAIHTDTYRWAVVFENQRGLVFASVPYFSRLSLLPSDPLPYTLPNASVKRSQQPNFTLNSYPLPSGQWKWVSKQWMIDMRSEGGLVQHDGFEYNWFFRKHHWRAEVGKMSAGGLVRRRKWIRLMVLPASSPLDNIPEPLPSSFPPASASHKDRRFPETGSSNSRRTSRSGASTLSDVDPEQIWIGHDLPHSWHIYKAYSLQYLKSDGHKLEAWCAWLGLPSGYILRHRPIEWSEDEQGSRITSSPASSSLIIRSSPIGNVVSAISMHYEDILRSFIYPQSRAEFLKLLTLTGTLDKLDVRAAEALQRLDFWSYGQEDNSFPKSLTPAPVASEAAP